MSSSRIVKCDPFLVSAIYKAMGNKLPSIPGDLAKLKSLTFCGEYFTGKEGDLLNGWIELSPGDFSAIGSMPNLHTLIFQSQFYKKIGDFDFLRQCRKLKKLDLSGTDFSDCELLKELPSLQYALLPDRQQLIHTDVLDQMQVQIETKPEMDERFRAKVLIDTVSKNSDSLDQIDTDTFAADPRLLYWIAVSIGKFPKTQKDLTEIRLLDSRKRNFGKPLENLPSWIAVKEGDFSLIGRLPNLQALLLWGVQLDDFSFLSECRRLIYVNLWDTNFTDCGLLAKLPDIRYVCLPEKAQLENLHLLVRWMDLCKQRERQKLEDFLYHTENIDVSEEEQVRTEQELANEPHFIIQCKGDSRQEMACTECQERSLIAEVYSLESQFLTEEIVDRGEVTVKGEDVVLSYGGESRVRYVEAVFWMNQIPSLWKVFSRKTNEDDNWAKLSSKKRRQLTDELIDAIVKKDVSTLCISLEPSGEDHSLILELNYGQVDISYINMDALIYYELCNPAYGSSKNTEKFAGQKYAELDGNHLAAEIVQHFLATGQLLPGTLWKKGGLI